MRLTTFMLADHASVREGTLGVLGGAINHLVRSEFPAKLHAHLAAVVVATPQEVEAGTLESAFRFWCQEASDENSVFEGQGRIQAPLVGGRTSAFPMVFDLTEIELPRAATYELFLEIDGEIAGQIEFYVDLNEGDFAGEE